MHYQISHTTEYTYNRPVFLEPHILKLFPESNIYQTVKSFDISVEPTPFVLSRYVDEMKNSVIQVWFEDLTQRLLIKTVFEVEIQRKNPFDFLTEPYAQNMKFKYENKLLPYLSPFLASEAKSDMVKEFAKILIKESENDTNTFLINLSKKIKESCKYEIREDGEPNHPEYTLSKLNGSCRDFTVLFIEACRSVGIASRFVSGYLYNPEIEHNHLHAWAEVYLPGGGWRGYDPTQGIAVGENHISLCSGANALDSTPINGRFRGNNAKSDMKASISIKPM